MTFGMISHYRFLTLGIQFFFPLLIFAQQVDEFDLLTDSLLQQMTLREKVNEMHGRGIIRNFFSYRFTGKQVPVRFGGNKRTGIPESRFCDGPRGLSFYRGATAFPVTMCRGATWNPELEYAVGVAMAKEIKAAGGNYSGAVCINILRHPAWGRAQETYGEDSYHLGEMGSALMRGIQSEQVQACVKHFALNSMENNRFGGDMQVDERSLQEIYLPHFRRLVDEGAVSIMTAYNRFRTEYCGHSKYLLQKILREDWGFKGYVTSDWLYGLHDAVKGITAGMNVEMPLAKHYAYRNVRRLLQSGTIQMADIDALIHPVVASKFRFFRAPETFVSQDVIGCAAHRQLARQVAEEGIVLLKNETQILPLDSSCKLIVVLGPKAKEKHTGDRGSSRVTNTQIVSLLSGLQQAGERYDCEVQWCAAVSGNEDIIRRANRVILLVGNDYRDEGEYISAGKMRDRNHPNRKNNLTGLGMFALAGDKTYLHLHSNESAMILDAALLNRQCVVVLQGGSAITVEEWEAQVPVVLHQFYCGQEGGTALARILFGEVNPSGKLPFTVPIRESDLPDFFSFDSVVRYGYYHGYRLFFRDSLPVRYPFGYGLSYTHFELLWDTVYTAADSLYLRVRITNSGKVAGAEVIQCYVAPPHMPDEREDFSLLAFHKIFLQPGDSRRISLAIPQSRMSQYDVTRNLWFMPKGPWEIRLGQGETDKSSGNCRTVVFN
jgi:beta-glucosidase